MARVRKRRWVHKGIEGQSFLVDYKDARGKRRSRQFDRRKDADDFAKTCNGGAAASHSVTFGDAADAWLKACEMGSVNHLKVEKSTLKQYRIHVNLHLKPYMGAKWIGAIDVMECQRFCEHMLKKPDLSRATGRKVLVSLCGTLQQAVRDGHITSNPAREIKIVMEKRVDDRVKIPSKEEMRRLFVKLDELATQRHIAQAKTWRRYRAIFMTFALTGLRSSELRGLTWKRVYFDRAMMEIDQRADEWNVIGAPKSVAGFRKIELSKDLLRVLREWRMECPQGPLGLVFPNWQGKAEARRNIHVRGWKPLQERAEMVDEAGQPRYKMHALRHFFASTLIDAGASAKEVMTVMGHSTITVAMNTYGHLFPDGEASRRARVDAIAAQLVAARTDRP